MNDILLITVPSIISAVIGWIIGFRKQNIDLCGQRLDELEKSLVVYNNIITDMSEKIADLKGEIKALEENINQLMKENRELKRDLIK